MLVGARFGVLSASSYLAKKCQFHAINLHTALNKETK
jgi:hypothetical protein